MKKLFLSIIMSIYVSAPAMGMHYVVDKDGTVRDTGRGETGCVLGDTKVYLENGEQVEISKISPSDQLRGLDNENQSIVISLVHGLEFKKVFRITTESGKSIVATEGHPFYKEGLLYKTSEFKLNDKIDTIDGGEIISKIESFHTKKEVFNIILGNQSSLNSPLNWKDYLRKYPFQQLTAQGHRLILNGFVSGDLILQKIQD